MRSAKTRQRGDAREGAGKTVLATGNLLTYFWRAVNKETQSYVVLEGKCAGPLVCPLSRIKAGHIVCIKQLSAPPEVGARLRELGFCEKQKIKLVSRQSDLICQVCNARLGISKRLADAIMVEALPAQTEAA